MALVIVTDHCYLQCESINHITVDVNNDASHLLRDDAIFRPKSSRKSKKPKPKSNFGDRLKKIQASSVYQVVVNFVPVSRNTNLNNSPVRDENSCTITVLGYETAMKAYKDIVRQIREQVPDQRFLNDLVEELLGEEKDGH